MANSGQKIKIATVCSGIGSPEQALKELDIPHEISFACEIDKYARQTYLANFTPNQMYTDLTAEEWDKPEQYSDLFIGGIPCQAFSLAGKRLGELDKRGLLFYDFYRYVKNQQPKVFII
jgi:DNA (cytosine-5)-methyltransferase 1